MTLEGKGFFIWRIPNCEGGDPAAITAAAKSANMTHIIIKIGDGAFPVNVDRTSGADLIPPVMQALRVAGMRVWGWHYIYGSDPLGEARIAIQRLQALGLDGYVVDAEAEFEQSGKASAARTFMSELRNSFPDLPIALSSFRYPNYHRTFPWVDFLEKCDFNMPQVYWEQAHNPATQLATSVNEFKKLTPFRQIYPTGPGYKANGWAPTDADTKAFLDAARSLNLSATNFFSWDECRRDLPAVWDMITAYSWPVGPQPQDLPEQYISALNSHDVSNLVSLYNDEAVHITADRTVQGDAALQAWYTTLLNQLIPGGKFTLTGKTGSGSYRSFTWQASSPKGSITNGDDTLGLAGDKISYHYSYFTVTPAG